MDLKGQVREREVERVFQTGDDKSKGISRKTWQPQVKQFEYFIQLVYIWSAR